MGGKNKYSYLYKGEMRTMNEICEILDISRNTLKAYVNKGVKLEDITKLKRKKAITVEYKGKTYGLKELSKKTGIGFDTLRGRYNRGMSGDEMCSYKKHMNTKESVGSQVVTINGVKMTLREIHIKYNLNLNNLIARYHRGARDESIINIKSINRDMTVNHFGKIVLIKDLAEETNISYNVLYQRVISGDRDMELIRPIISRKNNARIYIELDGEYYSMSELSKKFNISYETIKHRRILGKTGKDLIKPVRKKKK